MNLTVNERAQRYIAKRPQAISGNGGYDATFDVAAALVNGFALSDSDALTVQRESNQGCQPPWSERELLHKVESAKRSEIGLAARLLEGFTELKLAEKLRAQEIEISRIGTGRDRLSEEMKRRIADVLPKPAFELFDS